MAPSPSASSGSGSSPALSPGASASSSGSGAAAAGREYVGAGSTYFDLYHALAANENGESGATDVTDDYCLFNATETESSGCKRPRSCGACFRVQGCMLNTTGSCVSAALHYDESLDFRAATLYRNATLSIRTSYDYWNTSGAARHGAVQNWIFPSTLVDYCASNDTACQLCRLSIFADTRDAPDMRYCVGASGCVCTALCDSPQLENARNNATVCDKSKAPRTPLPPSALWVIGAGAVIVLAGALFWWMWRRTSESSEDGEAERAYGDETIDGRSLKGRRDKPAGAAGGAATSLSSVYLLPQAPDTPVMELSVSEYPRLSLDTSRRRPQSPVTNSS